VFRQWLEGNDPHLILTFDQEVALNRRDLPFITPVHPLTRLAVESLKQTDDAIGAHLTLRSTEISAGRYVIACDLWETISLRPEIRLVTVAWNLTENKPAPEVANQFLRLLSDDSLSAASSEETRNLFDKVAFNLDENAYQQRQRAIAELRARNELLVQRQLASLETYYKSRLKRIETELSNAQDSRIQTMKIAERNRAEGDFLQRRKEIERRRNADILTQRIASGTLEIVHE
jgi:ATP-dependent helicase HepA